MIYLIYLIIAIIVVLLSNKLAYYVDLLDRNTDLSGAFLGGVLLAAVTSLPELFTSLSATILLNKSDLVLGNILGSNIFNMAVLGALMLISFKSFVRSQLSESHKYTAIFILIIYSIIGVQEVIKTNVSFLGLELISIIIALVYLYSVKSMSSDDTGGEDEEEIQTELSTRTILIKFTFLSIALVISSILITFVTNEIAIKLNLGMTFAGALLLGIATSLPELASCIALVKMGNFNATSGNILGSCLFNFLILTVADLSYNSGSIYITNSEGEHLVFLGLISAIMMTVTFILKTTGEPSAQNKRRILFFLSGAIAVFSYFLFIAISVG